MKIIGELFVIHITS